jgi:hypothetical protein
MQEGSEQFAAEEARLWRKFLSASHLRIVVDTLKPIGASSGEMTTLICYDLHIDSKTVHCYPVSGDDSRIIMDGGYALLDDTFH